MDGRNATARLVFASTAIAALLVAYLADPAGFGSQHFVAALGVIVSVVNLLPPRSKGGSSDGSQPPAQG